MGLRFQDPPNTRGFDGDWSEVTAQLRENAGRWALLGEGMKVSLINAIRDGKIASIHPSNGYEVAARNTARDVKPPTCDIYVRYTAAKDTTLTAKERAAALRLEKKNEREAAND